MQEESVKTTPPVYIGTASTEPTKNMSFTIIDENSSMTNESSEELQMPMFEPKQNETFMNALNDSITEETLMQTESATEEEKIVLSEESNELEKNGTSSKESKEKILKSDEIFDTKVFLNSSSEVVTTRYFSSEERNSTEIKSAESKENGFNLTTTKPVFSKEISSVEIISMENSNMTGTNASSEAIMTMYHKEISSEELVTTRYISVESGAIESFEDGTNKTFEQSQEKFNLTTEDPFASNSVEYIEKIKPHEEGKFRKIILILNDSEETNINKTSNEDENLHILQAKPEEVIPYGITSKEAFEIIEKSEHRKGPLHFSEQLNEGNDTLTTEEPSLEETYG